MDTLQQVQEFRNKIEGLNGEIKRLRVRFNESNTLHQEREKELLRAITVANRRNKQLKAKVR